ncbi:MAG: hypothetical protein JST86_17145 [Bacteroidetes bacterium]|nr:hypothetical protein [Bacteroidota bacterium]
MKKYLVVLLLCMGCKKSTDTPVNPPCDTDPSYSTQVKSIFISNCTASGCHDGVDLPSLGDYTVARDAAQQIRDAVSRGIMPKNATLTAADKAAILCWIDNGAKNN